MKNKNQKEIETTNSTEETNVKSTEENVMPETDVQLKLTALEEKITAFEEKMNTIVSYLEKINEKNLNEEIEKTTAAPVENITEAYVNEDKSDMQSVARRVYEIARKDLYTELLPLVECAKKYKDREERDKVIKMMILTEEMADADKMADEMDEIIEKYPALKNSSDAMEKYVTAYVILKGKDACCSDKKMTVEKLMEAFETDEEFKRAVVMKMREDMKNQNELPVMNFQGGITALNIEEKPKNMQDAKNATFKLFK